MSAAAEHHQVGEERARRARQVEGGQAQAQQWLQRLAAGEGAGHGVGQADRQLAVLRAFFQEAAERGRIGAARQLARGANSAALGRFLEERAQDRKLTIGLTDTMARAFTGSKPLQPLLGLGLAALDLARPARTLLADLMMFGRR